jgi:Methyltransferase domain
MNSRQEKRMKAQWGLKVTFGLVALCCFLGAFLNMRPTATETVQNGRKATVANKSVSCASESSYELAYKQSLGYFDDISDDHWKRYQQRARTEPIYLDPNPDPAKMQTALWLLRNVDPIFTCPHLRRVGGRGDGPKWTCDPHRLLKQPNCLVYSIGSKGLYLFEDGLVGALGKHCEIHVFDPDPRYGRKGDPEKKNIHYHPWGLKGESDEDPGITSEEFKGLIFYSLPQIMDKLGHTGRRLDVFKIDCEGCEASSSVDWLAESMDIRQILIETHFALSRTNVTAFFERFLDQGFVPFSKEANTHPGAKPPGQLFEWGFLRLERDFLGRKTALTA